MAEHTPKVRLYEPEQPPDATLDLGAQVFTLDQLVMNVDADHIPIGQVIAVEVLKTTYIGYKPMDDLGPARQAFGQEVLTKLPAEALRKLGWLAREKSFPRDVVAVLDVNEPDELLLAMQAAGFVPAGESEHGDRWRLPDPHPPKTKKRSKK